MTDGGRSAEVDAADCQSAGRRFESGRPPPELDPAAIEQCIAVLAALRALAPDDPRFVAVQQAAAHLTKHAKKARRRERRRASVATDRAAIRGTGRAAAYVSAATALPAAASPAPGVLRLQRRCYVCKAPYTQLHAHYHALCPACAARNYAARTATADLAGRRALVTGGRTKIGFATAGALLAAGADVTITTRFPRDAADRYARVPGRERLTIVGLDFRDLRGLLAWIAARVATAEPLDILVNNAAQTVWRPAAYYARLDAAERGALPAPAALALADFPDRQDEDGTPLDLRPRNSWVLGAADVAPVELVEAQVINAIAPFLLASRLRPLLEASAFADRYIVNVTAMEGVFAYANKQPRHPHTNMAKAALNMFTRTSAPDYAAAGIHLVAVDTGWVTQENPAPGKARAEASGFVPPLDVVDGAARVLAPIWAGVRGAPVSGVLLKDYEPAAW